MPRKLAVALLLSVLAIVLVITSCEKEKIVESSEYIREYEQLPPDTIWLFDTVFTSDSVTVYTVDTVLSIDTLVQLVELLDTVIVHDTVTEIQQRWDTVTLVDTIFQGVTVYDTLLVVDTVVTVEHHYHYDTVTVIDTVYQQGGTNYDTVYIVDTVLTVEHHYDTVTVIDTVMNSQSTPNPFLGYTALQYYSDPLVFEAIYAEFGVEGGWTFYTSTYQVEFTIQSESVYDIYGQIDYWTPDYEGFYAFEFFWRIQYVSGDPADPRNWEMVDPPGYAPGIEPGIKLTQDRAPMRPAER